MAIHSSVRRIFGALLQRIGELASCLGQFGREIICKKRLRRGNGAVEGRGDVVKSERTSKETTRYPHLPTLDGRRGIAILGVCGGPVCSDRFFGFLSGIIARRNRGGGNVKISFIDFQGLWCVFR